MVRPKCYINLSNFSLFLEAKNKEKYMYMYIINRINTGNLHAIKGKSLGSGTEVWVTSYIILIIQSHDVPFTNETGIGSNLSSNLKYVKFGVCKIYKKKYYRCVNSIFHSSKSQICVLRSGKIQLNRHTNRKVRVFEILYHPAFIVNVPLQSG